jgi:DNA-binding SARP family transcriptional activator
MQSMLRLRRDRGSTPEIGVVHDSRRPAPPTPPHGALAEAIVEDFPFGILLFSPTTHAHAWNGAAGALLSDTLRPGATCCDLFGCRSAGVLERDCVTELALDADGPLPEIRVDLPGVEDDGGALWLTAARLSGGTDEIVVQVRPAHRRDRRRRTDPHWLAGPRLRIVALGRTRVFTDETPLDGRWLAQRPGQLLKYLLSQRTRAVHVDEIATSLWPDQGYEAQRNVRHTMHALRRRLEPNRANRAPSQFIVTRESAYRLGPEHVVVDADEFEALARAGLAALGGDRARARDRLERALSLYQGDFLADEPYAEWALNERDRLRELASRSLHALAELDRQAGDLSAAYEHLRRLAELEPLDVHVQRELLAVCLRRGRRTEAIRRFNALRRRTLRELGQEPGFRLTDLAAVCGEPAATEELPGNAPPGAPTVSDRRL